jgi:hypothetical protein
MVVTQLLISKRTYSTSEVGADQVTAHRAVDLQTYLLAGGSTPRRGRFQLSKANQRKAPRDLRAKVKEDVNAWKEGNSVPLSPLSPPPRRANPTVGRPQSSGSALLNSQRARFLADRVLCATHHLWSERTSSRGEAVLQNCRDPLMPSDCILRRFAAKLRWRPAKR